MRIRNKSRLEKGRFYLRLTVYFVRKLQIIIIHFIFQFSFSIGFMGLVDFRRIFYRLNWDSPLYGEKKLCLIS